MSIVDINYEFNFLGENTQLIGVKTVSYPPIDDSLVEKEVEPVVVAVVVAGCAAVGAVIGEILVTSYPIIAGGMEALPGLLNSMFGGGGSQALALAGGGTWELESAGVLEGILAGVLEGSVAVAGVSEFAKFAKGGSSNNEFKEPVSGKSAKEAAKDAPSWAKNWAKGNRPYNNESGKEFAKRLCDEKFGEGNYKTGPASDYNKIKKWGDRAFKKRR